MQVQIDTIRYQRNGISGTGFYAISFRFCDDGSDYRPMVGMLVTRSDEDPSRARSAEFCGVMDPANPRECWRGDHFEEHLLPACLAASESGAAFAEAA